jgi:hypothetical protein
MECFRGERVLVAQIRVVTVFSDGNEYTMNLDDPRLGLLVSAEADPDYCKLLN